MDKEKRLTTISWLESNAANGFFDGHPEGLIDDFSVMDDEDLEWYYYNWVLPDREEETFED